MSELGYNQSENECKHYPKKPNVSIGKIIAKVPVVLAELKLQINVNCVTEFPEPVLEIKDVKKRVKLTQCRLLLPSNKLFVKGFVRKNIQYASPSNEIDPSTKKSIASDIHSLTVDTPFDTVVEIEDYLSMPVMPKTNHRKEFDFGITESLPTGFPEKDELLTSDLSQFHQISDQYYNELPYCELISSHILEWDEAINRDTLPGPAPLHEHYFTKVEEKMVLDICLKVLQDQQVRVSSTTNDDPCKPHCSCSKCKHD